MELKNIFTALVANYSADQSLIDELWREIEKSYSHKKRYYHNLTHLERLIEQLQEYKNLIADWDTILFSVFYHDIVYKVLLKDNEERSANLAVNRLGQIGFPPQKVIVCSQQILATKAHTISNNPDTNLFTDADLSVPGLAQPEYATYCQQIRKEYSIYPDIVYNPGRKKVLNHFLQMDRIFKTPAFADKYEAQARANLSWELERLS